MLGSDTQKSCNGAREIGALGAHQFLLDNVSNKVLISGAAGIYKKKEKRGFKKEKPSEKASLTKRILSNWTFLHNLGRQSR
jgi:hypothetical protein